MAELGRSRVRKAAGDFEPFLTTLLLAVAGFHNPIVVKHVLRR